MPFDPDPLMVKELNFSHSSGEKGPIEQRPTPRNLLTWKAAGENCIAKRASFQPCAKYAALGIILGVKAY